MLRQKFLAYSRLVIKPAQRSLRSDLDQIAVAFFIFGQHQQVVIRIAVGRRARNDVIILLHTYNSQPTIGFTPTLLAAFTNALRQKYCRDRSSRPPHAQLVDPLHQFLDVASAIEHGVIAMKMQMYELILAHGQLNKRIASF